MNSRFHRRCTKVHSLAERYLDYNNIITEMTTIETFLQGGPRAGVNSALGTLEGAIQSAPSYFNDPDIEAVDLMVKDLEEIGSTIRLNEDLQYRLDKLLCPFAVEEEVFDPEDLIEFQQAYKSFKRALEEQDFSLIDSSEEQYASDEC